MERKMLLIGIVIVAVGLCSSGALAASMGPPVAGLEAGKWGTGLDYAYTDMTVALKTNLVEVADIFVPPPPDATLTAQFEETDDLESNMIFFNLGYGVSDRVEVFLRLGFSDIDVDIEDGDWDAGSDFAYGVGAKTTFYESGKLKLGGLAQMTWAGADGDVTVLRSEAAGIPFAEPTELSGNGEFEWDEIKIAIGPSYELTEGIWIYGGPFYHLINGDYDLDAAVTRVDGSALITVSGDMEEESDFGFYVGGQISITEKLPFYVEWQSTGDADVVGASIAYRF